MIDYETYCKIQDHRTRQGLTITQTAQALGLHPQTVSKWSRIEQYRPRPQPKRGSRLDPYKGLIVRWLDEHPLSAQQVFQRLREAGFSGGHTIVKNYVRIIRPPRQKAFLTLAFAPGECAQVDWGEYGTIAVGNTRRKLSFFVYVLCYSRMMYLEFTVSQTMEHFLACHEHAFAALGVPEKIMVDNLKSAVLRRLIGEDRVLNPGTWISLVIMTSGSSLVMCDRGGRRGGSSRESDTSRKICSTASSSPTFPPPIPPRASGVTRPPTCASTARPTAGPSICSRPTARCSRLRTPTPTTWRVS